MKRENPSGEQHLVVRLGGVTEAWQARLLSGKRREGKRRVGGWREGQGARQKKEVREKKKRSKVCIKRRKTRREKEKDG